VTRSIAKKAATPAAKASPPKAASPVAAAKAAPEADNSGGFLALVGVGVLVGATYYSGQFTPADVVTLPASVANTMSGAVQSFVGFARSQTGL
jgi:hypothetical protein